MTAITFDTLAYVKKLKKAGVPEKQAEAQVEITAEIMKATFDHKVATKQDLLVLQADLQSTLTMRTGAMIAAGATAVLTLMPVILKLVSLI